MLADVGVVMFGEGMQSAMKNHPGPDVSSDMMEKSCSVACSPPHTFSPAPNGSIDFGEREFQGLMLSQKLPESLRNVN